MKTSLDLLSINFQNYSFSETLIYRLPLIIRVAIWTGPLSTGNTVLQLITEPTRVTQNTSSIIDHINTTHPDRVSDIVLPKVGISDHFPEGITRCVNKCNFVTKYMTYRCFKQFNESSFVNELLSPGIIEVETLDDPSTSHIYVKV